MTGPEVTLETPMGGLSRGQWLRAMEELTSEEGYLEPVGLGHSALFLDQDPSVLLVTFEELDTVRLSNTDGHTLGFDLARRRGWSHLSILAHGETWFRDVAVYGYFDRLIDDGFFEDFDRVVFYGAEMGGYGAAAYSVASPGSTVVAVQPVATLDARVAGWDPRFADKRKFSFNTRYGYAPEMIEAADNAFVVYDPAEHLDAMHAALFDRGAVTPLRCPHLGGKIENDLDQMQILHEMLELAGDGRLTETKFFALYRRRRDHAAYLRRLLSHLEQEDRPYLAALLCRNAITRVNRKRFHEGLRDAQASLVERGVTFTWPKALGVV